MKKIAFITPPDAKYGFGLAGVPQYAVEPSATGEALKKAVEDPENGLVILDERLVGAGREAGGLSEERMHELEQTWHGILLVLPSPVKPPPETEDYAARLIRRAIGYHVRLKL
jgi:vacuolar-type H+-ATPase subunit F/Vma7